MENRKWKLKMKKGLENGVKLLAAELALFA